MPTVMKTIAHEVRELLPSFIFFFLAFSLIVITDALTTEEYGIKPFDVAGAFVMALIVAKVLLLAGLLPFVDLFPEKPLIYNTLWKTFLYVIFAMLLIFAEHLIEFSLKYGNLSAAGRHMISETDWPRFWAVRIWLAVMLLVFTALQELTRKMGPGSLRRMFFGR